MTIAACYLSTEGVVFGADSTTTITLVGESDGTRDRHYDFAQKIFQVGEVSTLGMVIWGMGSLPDCSYRTMVAEFADTLRQEPKLPDMGAVAKRWSEFFWVGYGKAFADPMGRARELHEKYERQVIDDAEKAELVRLLQGYSGGFCLGGNLEHARRPQAFEVVYRPWLKAPPEANPLQIGRARFWGCPNLIERVLLGAESALLDAIRQSPHWKGTDEQLWEVVAPFILQQQTLLPIREAIDWVHASIYSTIKAMKYSQLARVCGGPIEIAVITSDRPFRWVRHKPLGAAIKESGVQDA
jgi:hypothetical protein